MLSESAPTVAPASQAQAYAIEARGLGKCYGLYAHPSDRLKQLLWGRWRQFSREFWALRDVDLLIRNYDSLRMYFTVHADRLYLSHIVLQMGAS